MTVIVDFGVQVIIDMSKSTTKIYVGSFSDAEPDVFQDETGT